MDKSNIHPFRQWLFALIDENNEKETIANRRIGIFIMVLIVASVVAVMLDSDPTIAQTYTRPLYIFEVFAVGVFTLEYVSRIITADLQYQENQFKKAAWRYIRSPMAIIDLLAILPFYLELSQDILLYFGFRAVLDLRFIRILRLMRLLRIFKLNRYNESMKLISEVLQEEREKLLLTIFITVILLVLSSALIFTAEQHGEHAEQFPNMYSSMWWAIATLTTVGYGDVYPVTTIGKILAGVIALLGIGLVALPTGILSSAFVERINKDKDKSKKCPHCGKDIHH